MPSATSSLDKLTADQSRQLVERLAAISNSSLPLASGLRAAAGEVSNRRLRRGMEQLAARFDQGEALDQVLSAQLPHMHRALRGIISVALDSGQLGTVLDAYVEHQAVRRDLAASVRGVVAYPALMLLLTFCWFMALSLFVMPEFVELMTERAGMDWTWDGSRQREGPREWIMVWWVTSGAWYVAAAAICGLLALLLLRFSVSADRWQRWKSALPLLGPVSRWLGLMQWARMLSVFLRHHIPLPQAIRWASQGSTDADLRQSGMRLAQGVEEGQSLSNLLRALHKTPATLALLVSWGEHVDQLPTALESAAGYLEERVRLRVELLRVIVPPIVFAMIMILIAISFGSVLLATLSAVSPFTYF